MRQGPKTDEQNKRKPKCANCFACFKGTEMCPLEDNYNPDKAIQLITEALAGRVKSKS